MITNKKKHLSKLPTSPVAGIEPEAALVDPGNLSGISVLSKILDLPIIIADNGYDVFHGGHL